MRVPFLAEQVGAVAHFGPMMCTYVGKLSQYTGRTSVYRTPSARPQGQETRAFPGLDLSDREVDLVIRDGDTLSRNRAYIEKDFSTKRRFLPTFSATRTLPSRSVLSTNPDSSNCCRMTPCPAGSRGRTARKRMERIDTGKRPEFPYGISHCRTRRPFRFAKTSKTLPYGDLLRSPSRRFERPLTLRLENSQPPVYSPAASGRLVLLEPIGDAPRKLLIDTIEQHSRIRLLTSNAEARPFAAFPIVSPRVPFRRRMRTPSLCPNRHTLCASPTQTAFAWRLPSYCGCISGAAGTLNEAIDDLAGNPHAYRLSLSGALDYHCTAVYPPRSADQ